MMNYKRGCLMRKIVEKHNDDLDPARGILNGLIASAILWFCIFLLGIGFGYAWRMLQGM